MRAAFETEGKESGKARLLVTAAVAAGKHKIDRGYEVANLSEYVIKLFTRMRTSSVQQ